MFYSLHTTWQFIFLFLGLAGLSFVGWRWSRWGAWLIIFLAPLYLLKIGNWPLTVLEALIWVFAGIWIIKKAQKYCHLRVTPRHWRGPAKAGPRESGNPPRICGASLVKPGMAEERLIEIVKSGLFWPILLILTGVILSALFSRDINVGLGIFKAWFLAPIIFGFVLDDILKEPDGLRGTFLALFASSFVISAIGFAYLMLGRLTFDGRLAAFYLSPNHLAMFLAPGIIAGFGWWFEARKIYQKIALFTVYCLLFTVLYFTYSYGAWLGLAAAAVFALFYFWKYKIISERQLFIVYCLLFIVFASIFFLQLNGANNEKLNNLLTSPRSSWQSRLMVWRAADKILKDNWLLGIGPGLFQKYYLEYQKYFPAPYLEWAAPQPHNLFLAWWLQAGLVGLVGFIWLLVNFFKSGVSALKSKNIALSVDGGRENDDMLLSRAAQEQYPAPTVPPSLREGEKKKGWVVAPTTKQPLIIFSMAVMIYFLIHGLVDTTGWKNDLALIFWVIVFLSYKAGRRAD